MKKVLVEGIKTSGRKIYTANEIPTDITDLSDGSQLVQTVNGKQDALTAENGIDITSNIISLLGLPYITTEPTADNTNGYLILVILSSEPATRYDGYVYIITESQV